MMRYHLLVVGFDEIVENKYLVDIEKVAGSGQMSGYTIVDLESARSPILARLEGISFRPEKTHFLPDDESDSYKIAFADVFRQVQARREPIRAYVATEVRAHEWYLRFFATRDVPTLVEKPVVAPVRGGRFRPELLHTTLRDICDVAGASVEQHSVMTLSRYHRVYNDHYIDRLRGIALRWGAPITSLHLRHAGGVWNRQDEYDWRDDHPYRYGYGMMMHGAYHYVDLAAQILLINREILADDRFLFCASAAVAAPVDQWIRVPRRASAHVDDLDATWGPSEPIREAYGETDLVSTFRVVSVKSGRVITLGTLAFEQTTPSIRSWGAFPERLYNKNGRVSMVDIEAQLSILHSSHVRVFDVPVRGTLESNIPGVDRIDASAHIQRRNNGSLDPSLAFLEHETFSGLFHSDSNRELMRRWLEGHEGRSSLTSHELTVQITQALLEAALRPGVEASFEF